MRAVLLVISLISAVVTMQADLEEALAAGSCTEVSAESSALFQVSDCHTELAGPAQPLASHAGPRIPWDKVKLVACLTIVTVSPINHGCLIPETPGDGVGPAQTMNAVLLEAVRRVRPPAVEVIVQPPGGRTLVNLDTIFLAEAETVTRPVRLLGRRVLLRITPSRFTWVHGDGSRQVTREPGRPYQRGLPMDEYVTHRYLDAGRTVHPRVDVGYSAKFSLDGGATWTDVVGVVTVSGPEAELRLVEARPVLVSG